MRLIDCFMDACTYTLFLVRAGDEPPAAPPPAAQRPVGLPDKPGFGPGPEGPGAFQSGKPSYERAREDILGLLDKAGVCARGRGFRAEDIAESHFAVCAWIDEAILTSAWSGAPEWKKLQLQRDFYNTNNAGVEFFERLEALGANHKPVREVYALCLALGFHGRYFHPDYQPVLAEIKSRNLELLLGDMATAQDLAGLKLFPQGYLGGQKVTSRSMRFRPFDWFSFLIPLVGAVISVELYFFYRNSLNIKLLEFFGNLQ